MSEFNQTQTTDQATLQRRAFRTAVVLLAVSIGVIVFYLVVYWQLRNWQMLVLTGAMSAYAVITLVSMRLIRAGRVSAGTWLCIIGMYPLGPISALFVTDVSLIVGIVFIVLVFVTASQALNTKQTGIATGISVGVTILNVLIDQLPLDYRLTLPILQAFIPIAGGTVVLIAVFFIARRAWQGNLRIKLTFFFVLGAVTPLLVIGALIGYQTYNNQLDQILLLESQVANRVAEQVENFIFERESELRTITDVRGLGNLPLNEQTALLSSLLSAQNLYDELILVNRTGDEQIYLSRLEIVTPDDMGDRRGAEEFERPKATGETYYGPVTFDEQTGEPRMIITIPIFDLRTGEISYTLIANFRFKTVWDLMAQADVAGSGIVYMINEDNRVVAHKNPSVVLQGTQAELPQEDTFTVGLDGTDVAMARAPIDLNDQSFYVIAEQPQSEATGAAIDSLIIIGVIIGLTLVGSTIFGTFMARLIATPILRLATAAQAVSEGDLSQEININTRDEIGNLAVAFNGMTNQLRDLIGSLEKQVSDRTRALETSTEVSRRLSTIMDQDQLVREVVEQLTIAFNYYHAHIYLYDDDKQNLIMMGGTGDAGRTMLARSHKIESGRGLVGRAAANNEVVLIPDVSQAEGWLPNPLLPDTKAEVAVPIAIGGDVLGVLDVQHNITNGLSEQDAELIQSIGNQVAIAIQNAQVYQRTQHQAVREARITAINQRIQSATSIENVLQIAVSELGQVLNAERTNIELSMTQQQNGDSDPIRDSATRK
jgi:putative methionine-R-sulfoxide reductase with GAF domain